MWVGGISTADYQDLESDERGAQNNHAIDGLYTPGSTFKLNTATAALQTGLIVPDPPTTTPGPSPSPGASTARRRASLHNATGDGRSARSTSPRPSPCRATTSSTTSAQSSTTGGPSTATRPSRTGGRSTATANRPASTCPTRRPGRVDSQAERQQAPRPGSNRLPQHHLVHRRQRGDGLRAGGHRDHPHRAGGGLLHLRQRRHPLRPQVAAAIVSPSGKVVKRFAPKVAGHVNLPPATYQAMLTGFEGVVNSPERHRLRRLSRASTSPAAWPARRGRRTPRSARSRPPGSSGSVPRWIPSTWWCASSTRPATAPPHRPPVVRAIFGYLAAHPVTAPGIPPTPALVQQTRPIAPARHLDHHHDPARRHHGHDHRRRRRLISASRRPRPPAGPWRSGGPVVPGRAWVRGPGALA